MSNFEKALVEVLKKEGGYVNNPLDNGGETYCGISRKYFPRWEGWAVIDEFDHFDDRLDSMVDNFYYTYFWEPLGLNDVEDGFVAGLLFDFGINIGKRAVTKKIQRVVGVEIDGFIGPVTLRAINNADRDTIVYHMLLEVLELYTQIANKNRSQKVFLLGWCNRAISSYYAYERYNKDK